MKRVYPIEEYCMGCGLCEVYCLVEHSKSKRIVDAYRKEFPKAMPLNHVEENGSTSISLSCRHCEDPLCVKACMTGAMKKTEDGRVVVNKEKCAGCWMCIMVCPVGAIQPDKTNSTVASKCDLCVERGTPVCVERCPNKALVYEDRDGGN